MQSQQSHHSHHFDLIIVGGGAAGMMAAISARRRYPHKSVAIIDRTFALGRKILVCGAGRCNITNVNLDTSAASHYYGADPAFIQSIFDKFGYQQIVQFFADLGVEVYVERKTDIGKLFPVTNQAQTVNTLLEDELQRLGVSVILNSEVGQIVKDPDGFTLSVKSVAADNTAGGSVQTFTSQYLILSAGGKTYPALGSNGSGYDLAAGLGHKVITPVPSALPLVSKNPLSHALQGTKLEIEATSIIAGQRIKTRADDVMFTQYGLSGPAILNISREISIRINRELKSDVEVSLNFFPGMQRAQVQELLHTRWQMRPSQSLELSLVGIFPTKIPGVLLKVCGINPEMAVSELQPAAEAELLDLLTDYRVQISGTRGWNEAEFTAGGVDTIEVEAGTLESKLVPGLFMCGEILDVDGDVGGFNLSWAWSSGFVAGQLS